MASPPLDKHDRRIALDRNLWGIVAQYAADRNFTMLDALRELVALGLATNPRDAALDSMRQLARAEVRRYASARTAQAFREIADDIARTFDGG